MRRQNAWARVIDDQTLLNMSIVLSRHDSVVLVSNSRTCSENEEIKSGVGQTPRKSIRRRLRESARPNIRKLLKQLD